MADDWASLADAAGGEVRASLSSSIQKAGKKLPWSPTSANWRAYERSLAEELERNMLEAASDAIRRASWRLRTECTIASSVRSKIRRLAERQAELIAENTKTAVSETKRKLTKLGLEPRQARRIVGSIAGLNRKQAGSVVRSLKKKLETGKQFGSALRNAESLGRRNSKSRATRIATVQAATAANMGIDFAMTCAAKEGAIRDPKRKWVKRDGACTVCQRLHGKTVPAGKNFRHPDTGAALRGGDAHLSCNCGVEYVFEKAKGERAVA